MDSSILLSIFIFLAAACIAVPLASRLMLGSVLGYLIAGIAIGPYGLGLIGDAVKIMHFAEFGVVMMLFVIGLELDPSTLWRMRRSIVGLGGAQVVITSAAISFIAHACGFEWQTSLAIGMALSLSSTALVLQLLQEKNLMQTPVGETSFSVLLFQDIAVIPILVLMPLMVFAPMGEATASSANLIAHWPGWAQALTVAGVIAAVIAVSRYGSPHLFRAIARTELREMFTATSLALVVGITLIMLLIGVSPALGAFVAGVVLGSSPYRKTLETDIEPFKGLLLGLFFISVGMGMEFSLAAQYPLLLAACVVGLMSVKGLMLFVLGRRFGLTPEHNWGFALALAQGGEFAFVLFQFGGSLALIPEEVTRFLTLVVACSIALTPLLMLYYERRIVPRFMSVLPTREYDDIHEQNPVIIAGFGRFGQVIGRFLSAQGVAITVLEKNPDQIDLLHKFGFQGYFGDASRLDMLRSAGAEKAKLLVIAVDDAETCLAIAELARTHFPKLTLFARARNRRHAYDLHKLGVAYFKRETFDSALHMAQDIMHFMGRPLKEINAKAEQFKTHDETTLRESFAFFENEPELVNFARLRREELAQLLQTDKEQL